MCVVWRVCVCVCVCVCVLCGGCVCVCVCVVEGEGVCFCTNSESMIDNTQLMVKVACFDTHRR